MKCLVSAILATLLIASLWAPAASLGEMAARTTVLHVEGMTCALCGKAIRRGLGRIDGVRQVGIDQEHEQVTVEAAANVSPERLKQAVEGAGHYRVTITETR